MRIGIALAAAAAVLMLGGCEGRFFHFAENNSGDGVAAVSSVDENADSSSLDGIAAVSSAKGNTDADVSSIDENPGAEAASAVSDKEPFRDENPSDDAFDFPIYTGEPSIVLNDNMPDFSEEELFSFTGESYAELDSLGRCGPAEAKLDRSMMPKEERGEIGRIRPSGWNQAKYPGIVESEPPYLYNRCHLIAYALTGQNDNEKNLITGTRSMNIEGMLPFEIRAASFLDHSDLHVLYRVTPRFYGDELVARGVEMEAYSIEDDGAGLCFHVYVFNIQPGIEIDYETGESHIADG